VCRMTWRCSESFVSHVSYSGFHSGCSLPQNSNLSIGFHPVLYALSDVCWTSCVSCRQLYFSHILLDNTTTYQLEND
jgi:hypothetical protein